MKKTFLIILYSLFLIQLTIALIEYINRDGKFFGIADYFESFLIYNKAIILTTAIIACAFLLLIKQNRPSVKHIVVIGSILLIEFIKVLSYLFDDIPINNWL